ncbi:MAG: proprotein convertase P-domain-containing protein [Lysobacterales bacterium]
MAEKILNRLSLSAVTLAVAVALACVPEPGHAQAQNFQMRLDRAIVYTPLYPGGFADTVPPYSMCRYNGDGNSGMALRFRYTWNNTFQEYIYTEPGSTFYPYYYMQGVNPNPALVPATSGTGPVYKNVDVGLLTGPVNTLGVQTLTFRGRTSGFFGQPVMTASLPVQIETLFEPYPTVYREVPDGALDMPTQPWFAWSQSGTPESVRFDVAPCSNAAATNNSECTSAMPFAPTTTACGSSLYCSSGTANTLQLPITLVRNTAYEYRVIGRNICGLSDELASTPSRPFFRTAQACFTSGGSIPDGGTANFDVSTLGINPGSLAPNLRVTVHVDHAQVSDLRISLTKTSPDSAGPLLLMDRPSGPNCSGRRIQAVFRDGAISAVAACKSQEPAISGAISPVQALSSFASTQGGGNWRLTVEDTSANGKAGYLREWCLSADVPISPTAFVDPIIWGSGFETVSP